MKKSGTAVLATNGGERKMHYLLDGEKMYMLTNSESNKISQIKADNRVSVEGKAYTAEVLIDAEKVAEVNAKLVEHSGLLVKIINKFNKGKNDCAIVLTEMKIGE